MSVHHGTIGGNVGGRFVSLPVTAVHCDRCEEVYVSLCIDAGVATFEAEANDWDCSESTDRNDFGVCETTDLCPDCAAKAPTGGAST